MCQEPPRVVASGFRLLSPPPGSHKPGASASRLSIKAKQEAAMRRTLGYAACVFRKYGRDTERYRYAYGKYAPAPPSGESS